jgi:hypothetical protein
MHTLKIHYLTNTFLVQPFLFQQHQQQFIPGASTRNAGVSAQEPIVSKHHGDLKGFLAELATAREKIFELNRENVQLKVIGWLRIIFDRFVCIYHFR